MRLDDKVVLITGAKGGLGTHVTEAFLASGAQVIGVSRSIRDSDFQNPAFTAISSELSSLDNAKAVAEQVVSRLGRIDALVHLVGGFSGGVPVADSDDGALDRMMDVNLRSAFHIMRAVLAPMRRQGAGRVLAIGSRAAGEPVVGLGVYAASKAALAALVRTVALENKDKGIAANLVLPGTMDTPANRAASPGADYSGWVCPGQVANLLVHLVSDNARQVSGAAIPIYGREL